MSLTDAFLSAFADAYREAKDTFDAATWEQVWKTHWNRFMLWNPVPPLQVPVLGRVAERMGLKYWDREPFRVDAAFVKPDFRVVGNLPVPLIVAIEHENDLRTFLQWNRVRHSY